MNDGLYNICMLGKQVTKLESFIERHPGQLCLKWTTRHL